jgi:hypothetical protein
MGAAPLQARRRTKRVAYYDLKGEGTVCGIDDVPDRKGKRPHRFNIQLAHERHVEVAAPSAAEKVRWIANLQEALSLGPSAASASSGTNNTSQQAQMQQLAKLSQELEASKSEIERLRKQLPEQASGDPPSVSSSTVSASGDPIVASFGGQSLASVLFGDHSSLTPSLLCKMSSSQVNEALSSLLPHLGAVVQRAYLSEGQQGASVAGGGGDTATPAATSRGEYRRTIDDAIGPASQLTRTWKEDFAKLGAEYLQEAGARLEDHPQFASADAWVARQENNGNLKMAMDAGYVREDAEVLSVLNAPPVRSEVGAALAEGSDRYAALTHALYGVLAAKARATAELAPKCYWPITTVSLSQTQRVDHRLGLAETDRRWHRILEPDDTDFCGFTTFAPMDLVQADERLYSPDGLQVLTKGGKFYTTNSDVVCFESAPAERGGKVLHTAVKRGAAEYALPPFTLLAVVKVEEGGEWDYLPGKCINQRLITVRPTFVTPAAVGAGEVDANKYAASHRYLAFGNSEDVQRGLVELTGEAPLTMEQEWARNDRWEDWKGVVFCGTEEWKYVMGAAQEQAGGRDAGHGNWALARFIDEANVAVRAAAAATAAAAGNKWASTLMLSGMPELTEQEVVAIRLYTGPAYQPINGFLREVSKLGKEWRQRLAHSHQFTYARTVEHLSSGLRKLARVNTNFGRVFRGLRGELPEAFWLRDAFGMVTATEFGFMSTSLGLAVSESFLPVSESGKCIMWEIVCSAETDEGFHSGADVSVLSQFPSEREMLFPPLTMLTVKTEADSSTGRTGGTAATTAEGVEYTLITAIPTFI